MMRVSDHLDGSRGWRKGDERSDILDFLSWFEVIHTDDMIMTLAAELRRITRNRRDFKLAELMHGHVRTPYELTNTTPVGFMNVVPRPGPPRVTPPPDFGQSLPSGEEL